MHRDWTKIPTYRIMMKSQIAHEVTELSVLQCHASEQRVELVEAWKECLTLAGTNSKNKEKRTVTDLIDSMVLLPCQVSAVVDKIGRASCRERVCAIV